MFGSKAYVLLPPTLFSPSPVLLFVTDVFSGLSFLLSQSPLLPPRHFYPVISKSPTASSANINAITCANKYVALTYRHVQPLSWHQRLMTPTGVGPRKPNTCTFVPFVRYISTGFAPESSHRKSSRCTSSSLLPYFLSRTFFASLFPFCSVGKEIFPIPQKLTKWQVH